MSLPPISEQITDHTRVAVDFKKGGLVFEGGEEVAHQVAIVPFCSLPRTGCVCPVVRVVFRHAI